MKIDKKLEIGFIKAIQKNSKERTKEDEKAIDNRNQNINNQFIWTKEVEDKLLLLNKIFRKEERKVFIQYRQLQKHSQKMVDDGNVDDFEFEITWDCVNETHYIKYDDSIQGNPFYSNNCIGNFMVFQDKDTYVANCHNTLSNCYLSLIPRSSPILTESHCYMFHHLYDHCNDLTWFDICNIESIWIEIKVNYQFFSKIKI